MASPVSHSHAAAEGALPIRAFYFAYLGALGLFMPFFGLYLASLGLGDREVTRVLAVGPTCGLLAPPLFGMIADALGSRTRLLHVASVATTIAFAGFFVAGASRPALYGTAALFALCRSPLTSLVDTTALDVARRGGPGYGALRLWGSIGFLVAVVLGGFLLDGRGPRAALAPTTIGLAACALFALALPSSPSALRAPAGLVAPVGAAARPSSAAVSAWRRLVAASDLWRFLGAVVLAQAAGAAYDAGLSLHLARLGHSHRFIGLVWATGVVGEVALLAVSGRVLARVGAPRLFFAAVAVSSLRWLALAFVRAPWLLLALQPLHGVTFGFFYVAATNQVRQRSTDAAAATGQGLLAGAMALGSIVGMPFVGELLERGGGRLLFSVASGVALVGALLAATVVPRRVPAALAPSESRGRRAA